MSQKQRVTAYLQRIENDLASIANADNKELFIAVANNVAVTKNLCLQCLPEKNCSAYETLYDDIIRDLKEIVEVKNAKQGKRLFSRCLELIKRLINKTEREKKFKKDIVFLPYKASMWDSLESVWKAATADKDRCNAFVMPIPYAERNPDGSVALWRCERDEFPKYVPTLDWQAIDLKEWHPDVIVYHNPYDDVNTITSVEGRYYSRNLKECADRLIYIPYFVLEEPCSKEGVEHFATTPGVFNADKVIVQSEDIRQLYIDVLVEKSNQPSRKYWEEHILGLGSPKIDKVLTSTREDFELPEEWKKLTEGKKVVLYNTSIAATLTNVDKVCDKLRYVFDVFRNRDDVVLWWRPHPLMKPTIHAGCPQIEEEYLALEKEYVEEGFGIYDESPDVHRAICFSDAYYGDGSSVLDLYKYTNKPIMLQDICIVGKTKHIPVELSTFCISSNMWIYCVDATKNVLLKHSSNNGITQFIGIIPGKQRHLPFAYMDICEFDGKLYIIPCWGQEIVFYDTRTSIMGRIQLKNAEKFKSNMMFEHGCIVENFLYCFPLSYEYLVKIDINSGRIEYIDYVKKIEEFTGENNIGYSIEYSIVDKNGMWISKISHTDLYFFFNLKNQTGTLRKISKKTYSSMAKINQYLYLAIEGKIEKYDIENECITESIDTKYKKIKLDSFGTKHIVAENLETGAFKILDEQMNIIAESHIEESLEMRMYAGCYKGITKSIKNRVYYYSTKNGKFKIMDECNLECVDEELKLEISEEDSNLMSKELIEDAILFWDKEGGSINENSVMTVDEYIFFIDKITERDMLVTNCQNESVSKILQCVLKD